MIDYIINMLNIAPEYVKIAFWCCFMVGLVILYRFRRIVIIISSCVIGIYLSIKNSLTGDE